MSSRRWKGLCRAVAMVSISAGLLTGMTGPASAAGPTTVPDCNEPREFAEAGLSITMTVCGTAELIGRNNWRVTAWELITVNDSRGFEEGLVGCELGVTGGLANAAPRMPGFASCLDIVNAGEVRRNLGGVTLFAGGPVQPDWRVTFTIRFASNGGSVRMVAVRRDIPLPQA